MVAERARAQASDAALARIERDDKLTFAEFLAEQEPVDVVWRLLVSLVFRDASSENLGALSFPARTLYLVGVMDGEIYNGGFHQYFSNSSGKYAHETLECLVQLGALEAAGLLRAAMSAFPARRVPADRSERNAALDDVPPKDLDALDKKYYSLGDTGAEDLSSLMVAFMERHSNEVIAA